MKQFITIKEAGILTGKAEITIRRLIKRLSSQDASATTQMIIRKKTPSGYTYKVNTEWLLKELKMEFLLSNQKTSQKSRQTNQVTTQTGNQKNRQTNQTNNQKSRQKENVAKAKEEKADQESTQAKKQNKDATMAILKETIGILREQLRAKDNQLTEKHEESQELIRGNREAIATVNVLTKQLQLAAGTKDPASEPEVVKEVPEDARAETMQTTGIDAANSAEQGSDVSEKPAQKKGFFNFFK